MKVAVPANLARLDVALLYPPFLERLSDALHALNISETTYVATSGYRTPKLQKVLKDKPGQKSHPRRAALLLPQLRAGHGLLPLLRPPHGELGGRRTTTPSARSASAGSSCGAAAGRTATTATSSGLASSPRDELEPLKRVWEAHNAKEQADGTALRACWDYVTNASDTMPLLVSDLNPPRSKTT
jgi:hypothetical protein